MGPESGNASDTVLQLKHQDGISPCALGAWLSGLGIVGRPNPNQIGSFTQWNFPQWTENPPGFLPAPEEKYLDSLQGGPPCTYLTSSILVSITTSEAAFLAG